MVKDTRLTYNEVFISGGQYLKGITDAEGSELLKHGAAVLPNMGPQRTIHLDAFWIDRYPVTNEQFLEFVLQTGYIAQGRSGWGIWLDYFQPGQQKLPVVSVSWADMNRYAGWARKRLPTEAEWEKASRGTDGRLWPWGNEFAPERCNSQESGIGERSPVDRYETSQSPFGCFDMAGNVWEMVSDWWDVGPDGMSNYLANCPSRNPTGPGVGVAKVIKGGAFSTLLGNCACAFRICHDDSTQWDRVGFRCVRPADNTLRP